MPLTVDCVCEGDTQASICRITKLTFVHSWEGGTQFYKLTIFGPTNYEFIGDGGTTYEQDLTPIADWVADWNGIGLLFEVDRSLFKLGGDGETDDNPINPESVDGVGVNFYIRVDYECLVNGVVYAKWSEQKTNESGLGVKCGDCPVGGGRRSKAEIQDGYAQGVVFCSTTLGGAYCSVSRGWDSDPPQFSDIVQILAGGHSCLCVSGGTPPYSVQLVSGQFPCGGALDELGCVAGVPDGTCPGTPTVTYKITDSEGEEALLDCSYVAGCPDCQNAVNYTVPY